MDLAALHECGLAKETADRAQCLGAIDHPQARPLAIAPRGDLQPQRTSKASTTT